MSAALRVVIDHAVNHVCIRQVSERRCWPQRSSTWSGHQWIASVCQSSCGGNSWSLWSPHREVISRCVWFSRRPELSELYARWILQPLFVADQCYSNQARSLSQSAELVSQTIRQSDPWCHWMPMDRESDAARNVRQPREALSRLLPGYRWHCSRRCKSYRANHLDRRILWFAFCLLQFQAKAEDALEDLQSLLQHVPEAQCETFDRSDEESIGLSRQEHHDQNSSSVFCACIYDFVPARLEFLEMFWIHRDKVHRCELMLQSSACQCLHQTLSHCWHLLAYRSQKTWR